MIRLRLGFRGLIRMGCFADGLRRRRRGLGGDCMVVLDRLCSNWFALCIDVHNYILNIHSGMRYFRHYH